jgi:hypothetical protein
MSWRDWQVHLAGNDMQMLTIRQFMDFWNYVREGSKDRAAVYNANGERVVKGRLMAAVNEIAGDYRGCQYEWLDAHFVSIDEKDFMMYFAHRIGSKKGSHLPSPASQVVGNDVLKGNKTGLFDLLNHQGLPNKAPGWVENLERQFIYICPKGREQEGKFAYFMGHREPTMRTLNCNSDGSALYSVRAAAIKPEDLKIKI